MNTQSHTNGHSRALLGPGERFRLLDEIRVPAHTAPTTLSQLADEFAASEALKRPDVDVAAASLTFTSAGNVEIPGQGEYALTPWTKKQLAGRLGVSWDRWFDGIDPAMRADEINRRLGRDSGTVRLKTSVVAETGGADGTLRGIASTTYSTIPDEMIAGTVLAAIGGAGRLLRHAVTDRTTTYVVQIGSPFQLGGPARVGDVVGGLLIRNSDVGYASLIIALNLTRLVCTNGMTVAEQKTIVHRAHRRIDGADLKKRLALGLRDAPSQLQRAGRALERSGHHGIDDVPGALADVLRGARIPQRLLAIMLTAYEREPHPSVFGIAQAITLGVQDPRVSAEDRVALERAAGEYVAKYSPA
jgi:hypothetical protein